MSHSGDMHKIVLEATKIIFFTCTGMCLRHLKIIPQIVRESSGLQDKENHILREAQRRSSAKKCKIRRKLCAEL